MAILQGIEEFSDYGTHKQVYLATHNGEGNRLPFVNRAYISFSYGGKHIEDFNLLATMGDRLSKNVYANFEDATSEYDTLDGQYYWGTHFTTNQLEFTLSTDGMTQEDLEAFKIWFCPGVERELILAEHPNRAILARISAPPSISMIPFEEPVQVQVNGIVYETTTALYKGDISLSFIMDEPFWASILNYIPSYVDAETLEERTATDDNIINTSGNKTLLKVFLEDRIPYQSSLINKDDLGTQFFLGTYGVVNTAATVMTSINGVPPLTIRSEDTIMNGATYTSRTRLGVYIKQLEEGQGLDLNNNTNQYLFYAGTAPSCPVISFSMIPQFNGDYIVNPINKIGLENTASVNQELTESYIQIDEKKFIFTTPSPWAGYNQAVKIIKKYDENDSLIELKEELRDYITDKYSRAAAIQCVEAELNNNNTGKLGENSQSSMLSTLKQFISNAENGGKARFIFDSKTGEATGTFNLYINSENKEITQNVGDMVRSNYLIIDKRNKLDENGDIIIENCTEISTNENLTDFLILYRNMYL